MACREIRTPELRFRGFLDDWEQRKLGELMDFSNGINAPKERYGKGRKMISVLDIIDENPITYKNIRNSVDVHRQIEDKNKVENGDLVFVRSSEVLEEVGWSKAYLEEEHALYSGFSIRGKQKGEFDARFIELSLNSSNRKQIERKAGGSTRFNVSQPILNNVVIKEPFIEEQTKIGNFFKQLDDTIALHQQKLDKLKQLKNGYLQVMFPQKDEDVPKLRFAEFDEKWEQHKLGDITESYSGGTPSIGKKSYYGGKIPFIRSAEINATSTELFITEEGLHNSSSKMVDMGDILYALYGATSGEVGISRIHGAINQAILALKPKYGNNTYFIVQWLKKQKNTIINTYLQGGQGNLSGSIVKNLSLTLPRDKEQKQIGDFFKQLDEIINLYQIKIKNLQLLKKVYLQKMFI